MKKYLVFIVVFAFIPYLVVGNLQPPNPKKSEKLPPCKLCTVLIESFQKGMDKTARGNHQGGDTAWEEDRLRNYKTSEVRLVEIQETLCKDVTRGEDQCHILAEKLEELIEEWFHNQQDSHPDFHKWLCVEKTSVCCPGDHYGPECKACDNCHGNGVCKGNGTRKGNGKCACDVGYVGENCMQCSHEYYEAFRDDEKLLCSICHVACKEDAGCTGGGPKACRVCADGWLMQPENGGCIDVDECATGRHQCTSNQFCINNDGSYKCLECDRSCDGCNGDGPDLCDKCADGYELRDGLCKDLTNEKRQSYVTFTRYLTYFGLCIATCVIFQSSTWIASLIGLAVALYITISEYWLHMNPAPKDGPKPLEDFFND